MQGGGTAEGQPSKGGAWIQSMWRREAGLDPTGRLLCGCPLSLEGESSSMLASGGPPHVGRLSPPRLSVSETPLLDHLWDTVSGP